MEDEEAMAGTSGSIQDTKPCPACGETIKRAALKCKHCGEDLEAFAARHGISEEVRFYSGQPAAFFRLGQYFWAVVTLGVAALVYTWRARSVHFEITNQRIKIRSGVLSQSIENLELFRVDHVHVDAPFSMRALGYGVIRLATSDRSESEVVLWGLRDYERLAEQIREGALRERKRRGVMAVAQV